jgi:hypothetical protein
VYQIEAEILGRLPPDERRTERQASAAALLKDLHKWLHTTARKVSKKSELAGAIGYTLSRWTALTRYCDDGRIEIDNNAAERALLLEEKLSFRRFRCRWRSRRCVL